MTPENGDFEIHAAYGGFMRYNFSKRLAIRLSMLSGGMSGSDANSSDYVKQSRNLSFKSRFMEIGLTPEINLLPLDPGSLTQNITSNC